MEQSETIHLRKVSKLSSNIFRTISVIAVFLVLEFFYVTIRSELNIDVTRIRISNRPMEGNVTLDYVVLQSYVMNLTGMSKTRLIPEKFDINNQQKNRQKELINYCSKNNQLKEELKDGVRNRKRALNLLYSEKQSVIYCTVPKVACTTWKRMLKVFDGEFTNPFQVRNKESIHKLKYSNLNGLNKTERKRRIDSYYSFMFVRHPFERLLSAYRNKFLKPYNNKFQRRYGSQILRLFRKDLSEKEYKAGKNVTFKEFIGFVIHTYEKKGAKKLDEHWQIIHILCRPCSVRYNYIGKMETLLDDANQVLKEIGLDKKMTFPDANAKDKYKKDVRTIMEKYYLPLSSRAITKLYEIYKDDFLSFGYEVPKYLLSENIL